MNGDERELLRPWPPIFHMHAQELEKLGLGPTAIKNLIVKQLDLAEKIISAEAEYIKEVRKIMGQRK